MADEEKTPEQIAAEEAAAAKAKADADAAAAGNDDEGDEFDKDRAMALIRKQREEAKELRAKAKDADELRARLQKIEDADKTELERAQSRVQELEQSQASALERERRTNLRLAVFEKAATLGITAPSLAVAALRERGGIEYDDEGEPVNLDDALAALLEAEPALKGTPAKPKPPNTNGGDGSSGGEAPALTAEELDAARQAGMTPERFAAMKKVDNLADFQKLQARERAAKT